MYQLKHKKLGYYQLSLMGKIFWLSDKTAVLGIFKFKSFESCRAYRDLIIKQGGFKKDDFVIEPYNEELDRMLRSKGLRDQEIIEENRLILASAVRGMN